MSNVFDSVAKEVGMPTTEAGLKEQFKSELEAQDAQISNDSDYSPFWRLVSSLISKPALTLLQSLISFVLPNSFVKTATGKWLDMLAWGLNIERKSASKATGIVIFTRTNTSDELEVSAGVLIQSPAINGTIYSLVTTEAKRFDVGVGAISVAVEATETGSAFNLTDGYYTNLPAPVDGVESVTNPENWLLKPGSDQETDEELRLRCRNQFTALNQYHTDAVYTSLITSFDGVNVGNVYFESDAPRGPGTANAYVMFDIGEPDAAFLNEIESYIMAQGNHGHGDDLRVFAMPETLHNISVELVLDGNQMLGTTDELKAEVGQFIKAAFRENKDYSPTLTKPYSRFSFSKLTAELHRQFVELESVNFANTDIVSELSIPRINNLTVTVI